MNIYLTFLILLLTIAIAIIYFVLKINTKDNNNPHINPDPDSGKIKCNLSNNISELTKCDINDINSCNNCSGGIYNCTEVSDSNPYSYKIDNDVINIPNGSWCLPIKPKTLPCNLNSGYYVLSVIDGKPVWRCQCRYPNLFNNMGLGGDCIDETGCNSKEGLGNLICPCAKDDKNCTYCNPGEKWIDNPTWDPKNGICSCINGYKYLDQTFSGIEQKYCVNDSCSPGNYDSDKNTCICPPMNGDSGNRDSYINCPDDIMNKSICTEKQCIKDPCNPGGYYDKTKGHCVCDIDKNFIRSPAENILGEKCINACEGLNNPCSTRGTCYLSTQLDDNGQPIAKCKDCRRPYGQDFNCNDTNPCKCSYKLKNPYEKCIEDKECLSNDCVKVTFTNYKQCS